MDLRHYMRIAHRRERQRLAQECGTTVGYLYQVAGHHRRPGAALALRVEGATRGAVCRCRLRPDLFPPELCPLADHAHPVRAALPSLAETGPVGQRLLEGTGYGRSRQ